MASGRRRSPVVRAWRRSRGPRSRVSASIRSVANPSRSGLSAASFSRIGADGRVEIAEDHPRLRRGVRAARPRSRARSRLRLQRPDRRRTVAVGVGRLDGGRRKRVSAPKTHLEAVAAKDRPAMQKGRPGRRARDRRPSPAHGFARGPGPCAPSPRRSGHARRFPARISGADRGGCPVRIRNASWKWSSVAGSKTSCRHRISASIRAMIPAVSLRSMTSSRRFLRQVGIPVACTVQPLAGGVLPQPQVLYVEGRDAHGGQACVGAGRR